MINACGLERNSSFIYVGKSSLTVQFVDGHFVDSYYPTIENTFSKVIRYKNQDFAVEMIDTAGQVCSKKPAERNTRSWAKANANG